MYKVHVLMRHKTKARTLRTPSANEREQIMFLGKGFTRAAINPTIAKRDPVALEDCRKSLIGNTFHAGVVAWLFG